MNATDARFARPLPTMAVNCLHHRDGDCYCNKIMPPTPSVDELKRRDISTSAAVSEHQPQGGGQIDHTPTVPPATPDPNQDCYSVGGMSPRNARKQKVSDYAHGLTNLADQLARIGQHTQAVACRSRAGDLEQLAQML